MAIDTIQTELDRIRSGKQVIRTTVNEAQVHHYQNVIPETSPPYTIDHVTYKNGIKSLINDTYFLSPSYCYYTGIFSKNTNVASATTSIYATTITSTLSVPSLGTTLYWLYKIPLTVSGYAGIYGAYFKNGKRLEPNRLYFIGESSVGFRTNWTSSATITYEKIPLYAVVVDTVKVDSSELPPTYTKESHLYIVSLNSTINLIGDTNYGGMAFTDPITIVGPSFSAIGGTWSKSTTPTASKYLIGSTTLESNSDSRYFRTPVSIPEAASTLTKTQLFGIQYIGVTASATSGAFPTGTTMLMYKILTKANRVLIGDPDNGYIEYFIPKGMSFDSFVLLAETTTAGSQGAGVAYPRQTSEIPQVGGAWTDYIIRRSSSGHFTVKYVNLSGSVITEGNLRNAKTGATSITDVNDGDIYTLDKYVGVNIN